MMPRLASWSPRCAIGLAVSQPRSRNAGERGMDLLYLGDRLDLDRDIERQRARADGRARMLALVTEDLDHQVGGAVDDLRMFGKFGHAIDEADQLHDALHPVEIAAAGILELRHDI